MLAVKRRGRVALKRKCRGSVQRAVESPRQLLGTGVSSRHTRLPKNRAVFSAARAHYVPQPGIEVNEPRATREFNGRRWNGLPWNSGQKSCGVARVRRSVSRVPTPQLLLAWYLFNQETGQAGAALSSDPALQGHTHTDARVPMGALLKMPRAHFSRLCPILETDNVRSPSPENDEGASQVSDKEGGLEIVEDGNSSDGEQGEDESNGAKENDDGGDEAGDGDEAEEAGVEEEGGRRKTRSAASS
ncbi:hypothetical protein MRX96_019134 [Rhipicephalus microplus]